MIQVKQNVVTLKGITLRGSIQLYNPNQTLAVIFQIECPYDFQFCLEPKRGIIMQKQVKTIKVWVKDQDRERAFNTNFLGKSLKINCTMKAQYNRKIMQKLNINGWSQIKQSIQAVQVPIVVSSQAKSIRSELRQQASSSVHKMSIQGSRQLYGGRSKQKQQFKAGQSYNYGRSSIQLSRKKISDKLDRELDFLFQNQGASKISAENVRYSNHNQPKINHLQLPYTNQPRGDIVTYDPPFTNQPSYENINTSNKINLYSSNRQANNQRFLQILMLAALAGFFAALGSNFKQLFH